MVPISRLLINIVLTDKKIIVLASARMVNKNRSISHLLSVIKLLFIIGVKNITVY